MIPFGRTICLLLAVVAGAGAPAYGEQLRFGGTGAALGLSRTLAVAFEKANPGDRVEVVPGLGSGGAIAAVADNVLQVAVTGRVLTEAENAKGLTSTPLLRTAFVFVTARKGAAPLSRAQIVAIYAGELRSWPDGAEIKPILRPRSDAASQFLVERIPGMAAAMEALRKRSDVPVPATDQDNLEAAEQIAQSLAGSTLLQVTTENPRVSVIALDGVRPSIQAIEADVYPLLQDLFIVTPTQPSGLARRFLAFAASPAGTAIIRSSGALPLLRPLP